MTLEDTIKSKWDQKHGYTGTNGPFHMIIGTNGWWSVMLCNYKQDDPDCFIGIQKGISENGTAAIVAVCHVIRSFIESASEDINGKVEWK